jgi:hypothetical protein
MRLILTCGGGMNQRQISDWAASLDINDTPFLGMMPKCVEWRAIQPHPIRARIKGALWRPAQRWLPPAIPGKAELVNALYVGSFSDLDDRVCVRREEPKLVKWGWGEARMAMPEEDE